MTGRNLRGSKKVLYYQSFFTKLPKTFFHLEKIKVRLVGEVWSRCLPVVCGSPQIKNLLSKISMSWENQKTNFGILVWLYSTFLDPLKFRPVMQISDNSVCINYASMVGISRHPPFLGNRSRWRDLYVAITTSPKHTHAHTHIYTHTHAATPE